MRIQDVIGRNVKQAREEAGMSQRELGVNLAAGVGKAWLPQAVSAAERGEREWAAEDLVSVAIVLHRPVQWFFKVPEGVDPMEILDVRGDSTLPLIHLAHVSGEQPAKRTPDEIGQEIERLTRELVRDANDYAGLLEGRGGAE